MKRQFRIGDFCFCLDGGESLPVPENFARFADARGEAQYVYRLREADGLPAPQGTLIARRADLAVFAAPEGECRLLGVKGAGAFYALYRETGGREAEVLVLGQAREFLGLDTVFVSLLALERRMIARDSLILHCAFTEYRGRAILFSAPSGTGKSTQAALWERYRGSRTLNGDRALLRRAGGVWTACGWPVCGSSEICETGEVPIGAIVMLRQGKENRAERLAPARAFSLLYAQVTVNQWNPAFIRQAMALLEALIAQTPVVQLTCDMTEGAVRCLEALLFPQEA